jgi:hypothetical protein
MSIRFEAGVMDASSLQPGNIPPSSVLFLYIHKAGALYLFFCFFIFWRQGSAWEVFVMIPFGFWLPLILSS